MSCYLARDSRYAQRRAPLRICSSRSTWTSEPRTSRNRLSSDRQKPWQAVAATRAVRDRLRDVDGLAVLDGPGVDPLKLTLVLSGTGADGNAVERELLSAGLPVESADRDVLVAIVSLADTGATLDKLGAALATSIERLRGTPRPVLGPAAYRVEPETALPPRQAFFAPSEAVPIDRAVGRTSAELVAPYPPGIPVLAPGERVTHDTVAALDHARGSGVRIAYAADPTLATLRVTRS